MKLPKIGAALASLALATIAFAESKPVTLNVFEWEGYISPFADDFTKYAKEKGVDAKLNILKPFVTNADQIFDAVRQKSADVVTPTHNYYKMSNGKLIKVLMPIDTKQLSNYANLTGSLKSASYDDEGGAKYSVPLLGGSYGLGYNTEKAKEPNSWAVLWDEASKGKFSITNDQFEANVYMAMLMSGYPAESFYDIDKIQFDEEKVQEKLNVLVANSASFWGGVPDTKEMANLHYVTDYWFGVAMANQANQKWKLTDPKEGQTVWLDTMALSGHIKDDADKQKAAYLLLDFMISPAIQKKIYEMYGSVVVNTETAKLLSPEAAKSSRIGDEKFFKEEWFWKPLTDRTRNTYKKMWRTALEKSGKAK